MTRMSPGNPTSGIVVKAVMVGVSRPCEAEISSSDSGCVGAISQSAPLVLESEVLGPVGTVVTRLIHVTVAP